MDASKHSDEVKKRAQEQGQLIMRYASLRASYDELLAAAKHTVATAKIYGYNTDYLQAAIRAAEEPTP
jgi:hypothetical protein